MTSRLISLAISLDASRTYARSTFWIPLIIYKEPVFLSRVVQSAFSQLYTPNILLPANVCGRRGFNYRDAQRGLGCITSVG